MTPPFALSPLQRKVAVQWCQNELQEARLEKGESQVRMDPPARREDGLLPQQPTSLKLLSFRLTVVSGATRWAHRGKDETQVVEPKGIDPVLGAQPSPAQPNPSASNRCSPGCFATARPSSSLAVSQRNLPPYALPPKLASSGIPVVSMPLAEHQRINSPIYGRRYDPMSH